VRTVWTILALAAALFVAAAVPARAADAPPAPSITSGPDGPTNDSTPTFEFTPAGVPGISCELDGPDGPGEPVDACPSPYTTPDLPNAHYFFVVRATDPSGEFAETKREFIVDTVPPDTSISGGPRRFTNQTSSAFSLTASEDPLRFECKLTGPGHEADDFATCRTQLAYGSLNEGDYTFAARAIDLAGNVDPTPATLPFTVDITAPAAPALSGTPEAFTFSAEPDATFGCALDGPAGPGVFAPCTSPQSYLGLPPGAYTLRVRATDLAGNTGPSATLEFSVAAPPPGPVPPVPTPSPLPVPVPVRPPVPIPVFHSSVVARPGLADVRVRLPGSARYAALTGDRALPLGTILDTRRGAVQLVSVARGGGKLQRATFEGAVFRVTQPAGTTVLSLVGGCRPARQLAGDGSGAFAVRGRYSTATVRGARWVVRESCSGTLTRVREGVVQVRDQARRRTMLVRAGRSYLARPKRRG
jgi:hypothetical protein